MMWGRGMWGSGYCHYVTRKQLKVLCFHSLVKCHQKCEKYSKIIPTENNSFFCEKNHLNYRTPWWWSWRCEITVQRVEDDGRKIKMYGQSGRTARYVQMWARTPQKAVSRCLSVETKKKSKHPNIRTWYVPTCVYVPMYEELLRTITRMCRK